jgi:Tfp pilus assembly protein PilP
MKLTTGILAIAILAGGAWAQNPNVIDNVRSTAKSLEQKQTSDSNAALEAAGVPAATPSGKPSPGAPAAEPKQVINLLAKAAPQPAQVAAKAAAPASSQNNKLESVNVVRNSDSVQIEIASREAVTPRVSKMSSPARVLVELPATVMATSHNKISVDSGAVKGVRIGMNGKTPPTTSVVVDLEQAVAYELTPGPGNKYVLTLHTQGVAKNSAPAPVKASPAAATSAPSTKTSAAVPTVAKNTPTAAKPAPAPAANSVSTATESAKRDPMKPVKSKAVAAKAKSSETKAVAKQEAKPADTKPAADAKAAAAKPAETKPEDKKWAMNGKRDPFFSPVVQQPAGSGCSTGKKCLEIGQINVRGVVKSDNGFIAVVTNNLNKAYFLRENDPVFNGYVVKITGDSVVFQETVQDKLGKSFTREVVKKITTPAV